MSKKRFIGMLFIFCLLCLGTCTKNDHRVEAELVDVIKIWDAAPHNAFTDLIRFQNRWFCVFREGAAHVSPDGSLRIIESEDGQTWQSAALISSPDGDLRDAKLSITPNHRLMLLGAVALAQPATAKHQSLVWFSDNGRNWSEATAVGEPNLWLWRVTWYQDVGYGIAYATDGREFVRLYRSHDGQFFETWVDPLFSKIQFNKGYPNESSLLFTEDNLGYCLLRRDADTKTAQLGIAKFPFQEWSWKDLGMALGGPHQIALPDKRMIAAGRLYEPQRRTSLLWLDPKKGSLEEFLALPSGGDTSYPGLVWFDDLLWVSYYSSHEGKTAIYLARVKFSDPRH